MSNLHCYGVRLLECLAINGWKGQVDEENVTLGVYLWGVDVVAHYGLY